mmetsp:Transcript_43665/g.79656  ORF Transcript_43665/g.79656 Transcript_43665/m.79656 type:complete len:871 (-) Transcript_43665:104-2716(-)
MRAFAANGILALLLTYTSSGEHVESSTGKPHYAQREFGHCLLQSARQYIEETVQVTRASVEAGSLNGPVPKAVDSLNAIAEQAAALESEAVVQGESARQARASANQTDCSQVNSTEQEPCLALLHADGPEEVDPKVSNSTYWSWDQWSGYSFVNRVGKSISQLKHMVAGRLREGDTKAKSVAPRQHIKPLSFLGLLFLCVVLYPVLLMAVMVVLSGFVSACAPDKGCHLPPVPDEEPYEGSSPEGSGPVTSLARSTMAKSACSSSCSSSSSRPTVKPGLVQERRAAIQRQQESSGSDSDRSTAASTASQSSKILQEAAEQAQLRACSIDYSASVWSDSIWGKLCAFVPCTTLLVALAAVIASAWLCQREAFMVVIVLTSMFLLSTSAYMGTFSHFLHRDLKRNMAKAPSDFEGVHGEDGQLASSVVHWVVLPNYNEDLKVLSEAIQSIAESSIAKIQICLLLAMEEREHDCHAKADQLLAQFEDSFLYVKACFHPCGLANDPPGKASNNSWAFRELIGLVAAFKQDPESVVITIADADSMFHKLHFEYLSACFLDVEPHQRHYVIWQPAVFHMRNYHEQPSPVVVSTLVTAMAEGAVLADPNSVRFPYSTYSVPFKLAAAVGGWDAQWIAEDWHMGIKCYLFTFGRTQVRPLVMPVLNYTPHGNTWLETLWARWSQAKRHALGYTDVAYVFTVLPLLLRAIMREDRPRTSRFQDLVALLLTCMKVITRLINTHVLVAVLPLYMFSPPALRYMSPKMDQHVLDKMAIDVSWTLTFFTGIAMLVYAVKFQGIYDTLKEQIEPVSSGKTYWRSLFSRDCTHVLYLIVCLVFVGPFYFPLIGVATWLAAFKCMVSKTFDYEVALKPTSKAEKAK